jgi:hypothetical protein
MKKRGALLFISCLFIAMSLFSCSQDIKSIPNIQEKNIIANLGFTPGDNSLTYGSEVTKEDVLEISNIWVLAEIIDSTKVNFDSLMGIINFEYAAEIKKIYYSTNSDISVSNIITISSNSGIISANELQDMAGSSAHAQKFGYLNGEYTDNDYFISSSFNKIVLEVGKQYIIYLTDSTKESYGVYTDRSYGFVYEYSDGHLYSEIDRKESSKTIEMLEQEIYEEASNRTGIVEEIGISGYWNQSNQ